MIHVTGAKLLVVVDLAVHAEHLGLGLVKQRLGAILDIDDSQALVQ